LSSALFISQCFPAIYVQNFLIDDIHLNHFNHSKKCSNAARRSDDHPRWEDKHTVTTVTYYNRL